MATQGKEKVHKQDEIDMTKAKPNVMVANVTIFHQLVLGFAFGPQGFLDMLVAVKRNARVGGHAHCEPPGI